jgi:hypothetical protein
LAPGFVPRWKAHVRRLFSIRSFGDCDRVVTGASTFRDFPYYIAFVTDEGRVLVVAIADASRHPGYLKYRIP